MSKERPYVFAAYCVANSLADVTPEQARKLTHLNLAFGVVKENKIKITFVKKIRCDTKSRHQKVGITIKNQKIKNKRIESIKCQHIGGSFLAIEISIEKKVERCHKGQTDII